MEIQFINRATKELVTERPPGEDLLRFLYGNPVGEALVLPIAKRKFISDWYGKKMDSPSSVSRIEPFVRSLNIDMSESEKQIDEFTSFNDFFYRKLKPGARKIEEGLVSPGDGKLLVFEKASEVNSFFVKGERFTLEQFLEDEKLAEEYQDAAMAILRLAPNDYHRYHFPYPGIPSPCHEIGRDYYSVSPISLEKKFTKVFTKNKREICRLKTAGKGEMLIIPVGATMVGSLNSTFTPDSPVQKGEEMGYFAFGGSTIVLLFDSGKFTFDQDLIENTRNHFETAVRMGEKIASE
ncbi:archaetidylserine decarboxylase [Algoriphagus sp. NF]|uniref:archaetidylserine decarboxylase n=1 Tax=Algoriphagus sp. NF TaxID=2992756 RepID=UPI00237AFBC3|nr:archaetidylserine decarboxylase [Algoriphagus sp. NF]MDE0561498.1 archaetidylserine decarboxylase [Algoriphagus sp. NF]